MKYMLILWHCSTPYTINLLLEDTHSYSMWKAANKYCTTHIHSQHVRLRSGNSAGNDGAWNSTLPLLAAAATAAHLINRSLPIFYCHFILNCFTCPHKTLTWNVELGESIKMKNVFLNLKLSSVFRALNDSRNFIIEKSASEDGMVVAMLVFSSTMSRCRLDNLMDRVIETTANAGGRERKMKKKN